MSISLASQWVIPLMFWGASLFFVIITLRDKNKEINANEVTIPFAIIFAIGGTLIFLIVQGALK